MHKYLTLLLLLFTFATHAQIKGKITSTTGEGVPFVSVSIQNTYVSTTANEDGAYELPVKNQGSHTIIFQSLGFKTKKITTKADSFPHTLNITLENDNYELKELTISKGEDPAYAIIRNAIAKRKYNAEKSGRFEADFYSKGVYRVKNIPKKIMGMKVETEEEGLDSTGSGMIYLAETVSHITVDYPQKIKERIIASRVSGSDNGYSYNNAHENNYNFYDDYIEVEDVKMISPIAKGAAGYYKYKFEGSTFDENNQQINKIKIIARRDREPVFEGYIYIVEDSWAIYAVDLSTKGYRVQQPIIKEFNLQQNFSYNQTTGIWAKNSQNIDFTAGIFGMTFNGKYTHVYSNYVFQEKFEKEIFSKELTIVEKESAKKDTAYWNTTRPVPLSIDEVADYKKKDSIHSVRKSKVYQDSVITNANRFKPFDVISGYRYYKNDSIRHMVFNYSGLLDKPAYNTVQGWNLTSDVAFSYYNPKTKRSFSASAKFNYGFAEDRLRVSGQISKSFGKLGYYTFSGGNTIEQFNPNEPISPFINSISTLFFKDNYMKLYDKAFAKIATSRTLFKKILMSGSVEYLRRRPLYNNADWVFIKNDHDYTSNDPFQPYNYTSAPFEKHNMLKASVYGKILFKKDAPVYYGSYLSYDYKNSVPEISFLYEKGFAASNSSYNYDLISAQASYKTEIDNKGNFGISLKAGKFFNADGIAFMDYKHFNGNETQVGTKESYLDMFNLLPYYSHSTNNAYFETHIEHNFKGYIMNKIPLLNVLQWHLIAGYHSIATPDYKPYHEATIGFDNIGFGPFRFLRLDYVRSFQGSVQKDGIVFGLHFFLD
ncbi:DUF5686 and carboxypeptidase regulatory-like domain-containing protein [Flavobacterium sp. DG1-102-2]|uniref:DUF5686 and carboxypeptidase regulatory-like domain-containing protein n=1 Tax=Flavobacterium sp. DG1-102-2 TaxID=3081663 RepID=UPI00294A2083|nr:DUF5686 and carboxypeptidase regulatory-like domain-containing protein [Flavobacterium sp. DG1-102-2]MDV6167942.1 DUF5686 and carboxypeptidase regulatory-like domain-containing protein [Flavobacterium sp. DG1-102-2]